MNIVPVETASQDSLLVSAKTDTGGTDLFSILMASIAAGNNIQQGSYNVTADSGGPALTGQVTFSTVDGVIPGQDNGLVPGMPLTPLSAATTKEVTGQDACSDPGVGDLSAGLGKQDNAVLLQGLQGKASDKESHIDVGKAEDAGAISDTPVKEPIGDSVLLPAQVTKGESTEPSNPQLLLAQAVKGVKAGDGTEAERLAVKAGEFVSIKDDGAALDIEPEVVTAFGSESIDPRLLHASAKPLVAVESLRVTEKTHIDPDDLMAQVSGRIKADFKNEGGEVRMELHPESLGHLKIEIRVEGGVVRANILTENAMVRDTIDSNISILRSSLEEHGLRIDQLSVGVGQHHSGNAFAERKDLQRWQGFEAGEALFREGEEPVNESWYHADSWQEQGVSIFA